MFFLKNNTTLDLLILTNLINLTPKKKKISISICRSKQLSKKCITLTIVKVTLRLFAYTNLLYCIRCTTLLKNLINNGESRFNPSGTLLRTE